MRTLYLCGAGNLEGVRLALVVNREQARWEQRHPGGNNNTGVWLGKGVRTDAAWASA